MVERASTKCGFFLPQIIFGAWAAELYHGFRYDGRSDFRFAIRTSIITVNREVYLYEND